MKAANTPSSPVQLLRTYLQEQALDAFIVPSTDPHNSEYIPDHWAARQWVSGFDGSAGTVVITAEKGALWTDSRYFLSAEEQLQGSGLQLMKMGLPETPSIAEWLTETLPAGATVGIDGWVNSIGFIQSLQAELSKKNIHLRTDVEPFQSIWHNRPAIPENDVKIHPLEFAGITCRKKLAQLSAFIQARNTQTLLVTALDDIAWTLNLRGTDVHCNPVFVSYLLIDASGTATLFINPNKLTLEVKAYLQSEGIQIRSYEEIAEALRTHTVPLWLDTATANYALYSLLPTDCPIVSAPSPIAKLKAVKNEAEIAGFHQAMKRDGVAMVKFLKWLKPAVETGGVTEVSACERLRALRTEQPHFRDISFDTIAGYAAHGAIVHYEPTSESDIPLKPRGLLLLDSGAQYTDGTTDITRTIALGPLTDEERLDYTLVLKGHITLARARFPEGSSGTQLDVCARYAMWQQGINYGHGTGHGVGSYLNVHEGPHQIRMNYMPAPLVAGMTVTNEPGIYRAGKHGVRIENTQLIVPFAETEFGRFLQFEPLTLCPIDLTPVLPRLLSNEEIKWLNDYHQLVYDTLAPELDEPHRAWLQEATSPINLKH